MLSGLLVVLAGVGGWLALRAGRELRPPDDDERAEVAEPLARILCRHVGTEFLTEDLVDGIQLTAGVSAYVLTDPLSPSPKRRRRNLGEVPEDMTEHVNVTELEPI